MCFARAYQQYKLYLNTVSSPTISMGINDIPDEMLLMILAFVPYQACEGLTTLKLVNKRFLAITQMHSLKCQTIENQFAEIAAIYGLDDAVRMENIGLQGAAELTEEVNKAVKKLSLVGDKAVHCCMLEYGVILLDIYLTITEQFLIQDEGIDQRMMFALRASQNVFGTYGAASVRLVLARAFDILCPADSPVVVVMDSISVAFNSTGRGYLPKLSPMLKVRAFELGVLVVLENRDFHNLIMEGTFIEDDADVAMTSRLYFIVTLGTLEHKRRAVLKKDAEYEAQATRLQYLDGYRWRILSLPDQALRETKTIDNVSTLSTPVDKEYACDRDTRNAFDKMTICEITNHLNPRFLREARDLLEDEAKATLAGTELHGLTMPESFMDELEILVALT
ncbi:hypothetical protein LTR05_003856 [Lithohypha guttulata]|uniref:F-box domain-containing protein n=2 Tax=Lithohypha guttulata TaxID=1690604 RepID=A0AAN7T1B3_9EURO|nr:hypothetical protein LTR05_003856 [Lithohypha guttulata]